MSLTSLALWTAVPAGLLWLAARLDDGGQLSTSSAIILIAGIPGAIGLGGKALAELNNLYVRITGASVSPHRPPWLRSISDSRPSSPLTALDIVPIASVAVATISLALYIALNGVPTPPPLDLNLNQLPQPLPTPNDTRPEPVAPDHGPGVAGIGARNARHGPAGHAGS